MPVSGSRFNFILGGLAGALLADNRREEQAKVQGLNDFLVFGLVAFASFSSGALLNAFGCSAVQLAIATSTLGAMATIAWYRLVLLRRRTVDTLV